MSIPPFADAGALEPLTKAGLRRRVSAPPLEVAQKLLKHVQGGFTSLVPLLGFLTIKGKPYTLNDHFVMSPMFKLNLPRRMVWKCGRQVSKSYSLSSSGILRSSGTAYLQSLYVTPRYEQIRRLSSNIVRPLISNSYIRDMLIDETCVQHVLQRSFTNEAAMYFSFAFLDVDRVRGISADIIDIDEVQDMDYDFIPVIHECMSASKLSVSFYSGTPKTMDNGLQALWEDSSQAEWVTPCEACNHWSMASLQADLRNMIGSKGVVCGKCQKPINPRAGHWYHTAGKDHPDFHGYHVPQVVMPMHYDNPHKWHELLAKRDGRGNYSPQKFLNEVLGESADVGVKLITVTDIRNASVLGVNEYKEAVNRFKHCKVRVLGVDWGGGGEEEISFTTAALVGLNGRTGKCECHYCVRLHTAYTHDEEAKILMRLFQESFCHYMAHDYGGSGSVRETLMIQGGMPVERIVNFNYVRATARHMVAYVPPREGDIRGFYSVDKARALVLMATCVKSGIIQLPDYETSKDVTHDLLALMEDKHEMPAGADIFLIRRQPKLPDDFAHSLTYGCLAIWHTQQQYPDLSSANSIRMSDAQLSLASPPNAWEGEY